MSTIFGDAVARVALEVGPEVTNKDIRDILLIEGIACREDYETSYRLEIRIRYHLKRLGYRPVRTDEWPRRYAMTPISEDK